MKTISFLGKLAIGTVLLYFAVTNIQSGETAWAVTNLVLGVMNLVFAIEAIE